MAADSEARKSEGETAGEAKAGDSKSNSGKNGQSPVRIKKYANRRLYNTATSSYVTLDYLAQMVRNGIEFTVEDAKTGEDITRSVLTQIIVE
ncbi:MAG TPA: polyhydroxyalkanoate synthesis regulator DNA-binding domain-containing protein, partial [Dongiaceae bacterium]